MQLTAHFWKSEFACPCCGGCAVDSRLVTALEGLRVLVGSPIRVASGYRCQAHNAKVGGAKNSYHTKGVAADIWSPGVPLVAIYTAAEKTPAFHKGGIGLYPQENFVHVDVRSKPGRWGRIDGRYTDLHEALDILL